LSVSKIVLPYDIGTVLVRGVKNIGAIEDSSALKEAHELGTALE
jgi:hypothetical protein